jgi:hypothetical protein
LPATKQPSRWTEPEVFAVSRSERKPVAAMTEDEQMAALLLAARAVDEAKEGLAPCER